MEIDQEKKFLVASNNGKYYGYDPANPHSDFAADRDSAMRLHRGRADHLAYQLNGSPRYGDHAHFWVEEA